MVKLLELVQSYDEFRAGPALARKDEPESDALADAPAAKASEIARPSTLESSTSAILAHSSGSLGIDPEPGQLAAPISVVSPPTPTPAPVEARLEPDSEELYAKTLASVSGLYEAAAMETLSPGRLSAAAHESEQIAAELADRPSQGDGLLALALGTYPEGEGFVLPHSVNVAILAAYVGYQLQLPRAELTATVLAGLMHDIGNVRLPSGLLYKEEALTSEELAEVRKRPSFSSDLLFTLGPQFRQIAEIALQVYERMDGSGYPNGLEGSQILVEARILGAVDFFETTIHPRPYKASPRAGVNFGVQTLMRMAGQFGQSVLKALVRSVGLFPVGTYVRLSTGEIAQVLSVSRDNPMRPTVKVLFNKKNRPLESARLIDLVESPHLYVSRPCSIPDLVELGIVEASTAADRPVISEPDEGRTSSTAPAQE